MHISTKQPFSLHVHVYQTYTTNHKVRPTKYIYMYIYMPVYIGCHNEYVKSLGYTAMVRCQRTHNPAAISETENLFMITIPISEWACPGSKPYTDL